MLAVSGPFPLTSDQPPVAMIDTAALAQFLTSARRGADTAGPRGVAAATPAGAAPSGGETRESWRMEPARDPFALVGPRPAFEANVLEAERNLDAILARIELARSQAEMRRGTDPDAAAAKARAEAEARRDAQSPAAGEDVATLEAKRAEAEVALSRATQASDAEAREALEALTVDIAAMDGGAEAAETEAA